MGEKPFRFDAIIVGASVAGSCTAALLGARGFRTLLLDKAHFPREKVCGEGIMPVGAAILAGLGLEDELSRCGARAFYGVRFHLPSSRTLSLDFREYSDAAKGWVLARSDLDSLLFRHAASQPGVEALQGFIVRAASLNDSSVEVSGEHEGRPRTFHARVLIGADGIRSRFHALSGAKRVRASSRRFALRCYFENLENSATQVEVYCSRSAEAYVAPLGEGRARVTLLLDVDDSRQEHLAPEELYVRHLQRFPELVSRLQNPYPAHPVEATSPVAHRLTRSHGHRLLLAGDAGGAVDPITGQGISVALRDAQLAADILAKRIRQECLSARDLETYTLQRNAYFLPSYQLAQKLLLVLRHPFFSGRAATALDRSSALRAKILALINESRPSVSLTLGDQLRLLAGI